MANPIPQGFHTVTPFLVLRNAATGLEFYKRAFGAEEVECVTGPGGKIMHAEIRIGDSMLMLSDEFPDMGCHSPQALGGTPVSLYLYVRDVDALFKQAVAAGASALLPVTDMFWGDRYGKLADPFGHIWSLATRKEDLTPEEIGRRSEAYFAQAVM